jgi:NAD+ synthase (glutamine-hydrolysing)
VKIEDAHYTSFELKRTFGKHPFVPPLENREESCHEIFSIQMGGLTKRWKHTNSETLVVGISGGLDSTLALLVCVKTADKLGFDRKRIIGITMPGFGTTDRTYQNAVNLMESLGITMLEISIKEASLQHFSDINHNPEQHDVTYENTQARERTQILMDIANKHNGLVIGTGDLSELALGWATYNGDHMSMYAVNSGVPKTLVRYLVDFAAHQLDQKSKEILQDVLQTPVSPELLPAHENGDIAQKTEDIVGPYELHDFFLYYMVRFGFSPNKILFLAKNAFAEIYHTETIEKWMKIFIKRFFAQQFKRSCMPDGPKVGSINLSPRGDWRMPSDAVAFETPNPSRGT